METNGQSSKKKKLSGVLIDVSNDVKEVVPSISGMKGIDGS